MEWLIKSFSKQCSVNGKIFSDDDDVVCLVCRDSSGSIVRFDVLKENIPYFTLSGSVIGQWKRRVSSEKNKNTISQQCVAHCEEFFFSLYEGESTREKDILKQLFAFFLEKKRILRSFGKKMNGKQKFIHIKTKKEFLVSMEDFPPEDLTSLQNVFEMFV